jgi:hypothetical protein
LFAILTFAKPHKANKSNFTSTAPTKLHWCTTLALAILTNSLACDLHFSQKITNSTTHQIDHTCATTTYPRHKCAQHTPTRAMASFDPLSSFLVLLAISLECLGNIAVYLLDLPEWRMPREYIRSEYEPEEFCWYLTRWALDSRDTAFLFGVFFRLLLLMLILGFWLFQQHQARSMMAEYLENVFERAGTRVHSMAKIAVDTISKLQARLKDFETRHRDDQETITQLRGALDTSQSENADLRTELRAEKEVRQQEAEQALREKNKNSNTQQKSTDMRRMRRKQAKERKSKVRVIDRLKEINNERNVARDEAQKREKQLEQNVKQINAQAASDKKELSDKLSEAIKCNKLSKEQYEATKQEIQTQKDKISALSNKNAVTEQKCAKLEQDNKTLEISGQQHQKAHSKLATEHEKLSRNHSEATERADKLQRENEHAKKLRAGQRPVQSYSVYKGSWRQPMNRHRTKTPRSAQPGKRKRS